MAKTQPICYCLRNDAIERHLCIRIWWFSDDGKASARLIYVLSSLDLKFMTHCLNQCYQVVNWRTECCCDSKPNADYREITQLLPFDEIFSIYSITIDKLSKPMLPSSTVVNWLDWRTECCCDSKPNADFDNSLFNADYREITLLLPFDEIFFNLFNYRQIV